MDTSQNNEHSPNGHKESKSSVVLANGQTSTSTEKTHLTEGPGVC